MNTVGETNQGVTGALQLAQASAMAWYSELMRLETNCGDLGYVC